MQNNQKIISIFGAGGFLGKYLIRQLTKLDYRIKIATRNPYLKGYLKPLGNPGQIELFKTNIFDEEDVRRVLKNSDFAINLVGILYETRKQKFFNIHSEIPDAISKYCSEANVKKFIHVSAIGANKDSRSLYQKSKFEGEIKALNNFKNTIVIRPSVVCGTDDNFTNLFSKLSFLPVIPLLELIISFNLF